MKQARAELAALDSGTGSAAAAEEEVAAEDAAKAAPAAHPTRANPPESGCAAWRALNAGPSSRAANVGPVRACEGAPSLPPTKTVAARTAMPDTRPRAHTGSMSFVVDMRAPF